MLELLYGSAGFAPLAWREIDARRPVALRVTGWRKRTIHKTLSLYAEYDHQSRARNVSREQSFNLGWRSLLVPSLMGLVNHARARGMSVTVIDQGSTLEIRFAEPAKQ